MAYRVAIRWSRAANMPIRSWRVRVGWPVRIPANGLAAVHLRVGQEPQLLQLVGLQEVGLVDFSGRPRRKRRSDLGFHVACMSAT